MNALPRYLSPLQLAEALSLSRSQIYRLIASRQLPGVKFGRCVRVSVEALDQYAKAQQEPQPRLFRNGRLA
jgi:excisionase family DNA binding protein